MSEWPHFGLLNLRLAFFPFFLTFHVSMVFLRILNCVDVCLVTRSTLSYSSSTSFFALAISPFTSASLLLSFLPLPASSCNLFFSLKLLWWIGWLCQSCCRCLLWIQLPIFCQLAPNLPSPFSILRWLWLPFAYRLPSSTFSFRWSFPPPSSNLQGRRLPAASWQATPASPNWVSP